MRQAVNDTPSTSRMGEFLWISKLLFLYKIFKRCRNCGIFQSVHFQDTTNSNRSLAFERSQSLPVTTTAAARMRRSSLAARLMMWGVVYVELNIAKKLIKKISIIVIVLYVWALLHIHRRWNEKYLWSSHDERMAILESAMKFPKCVRRCELNNRFAAPSHSLRSQGRRGTR